jgi:tetratricopeptide (TPR) repeat protein
MDAGDYIGAVEDNNVSLALDPSRSLAYYNRALSYFRLGEYKKALEDVNAYIKSEKFTTRWGKNNEGAAYIIKGDICYNLQRYEEAVAAYNTAQNKNFSAETDSLAYDKALSYFNLREYKKALKEIDTCIKGRKFTTRWGKNNEGMVYFAKGEICAALQLYEEALEAYKTVQQNKDLLPLKQYLLSFYDSALLNVRLGEYKKGLQDMNVYSRTYERSRKITINNAPATLFYLMRLAYFFGVYGMRMGGILEGKLWIVVWENRP